jgi:hypothetical protein
MEELKVPKYFPTSTQECVPVTREFFTCFSREGKKTELGDLKAGQVGLNKCKNELMEYTRCMDRSIVKMNEKK